MASVIVIVKIRTTKYNVYLFRKAVDVSHFTTTVAMHDKSYQSVLAISKLIANNTSSSEMEYIYKLLGVMVVCSGVLYTTASTHIITAKISMHYFLFKFKYCLITMSDV